MALALLAGQGTDGVTHRGLLARKLGVLLGAIATVAAVSLAASAHHSDLTDPNDTRGTLDIRQVRLSHDRGAPQWTIRTFASWRIGPMWDRGSFVLWLDTSGNVAPEYYVLVRSTGNDLEATLWRDARTGRDRLLRHVSAHRKTGDGVTVGFPLSRLEFGGFRTSFNWYVQTLFLGPRCRLTCIDRAPDVGAVEQWLPGMSPSASPS